MNWFERFITNGNSHNLGAGALLLTGIFFPEVVPLAKAAMGAVGLVTSGAILPGGSVLPTPIANPAPPVVNLPAPAAGGSYHAIDYQKVVGALLEQFGKKSGRS